jgi:hypothetical protein
MVQTCRRRSPDDGAHLSGCDAPLLRRQSVRTTPQIAQSMRPCGREEPFLRTNGARVAPSLLARAVLKHPS